MGSNFAFHRILFLLLSVSPPTHVMSGNETSLNVVMFYNQEQFRDTVFPAFFVALKKVEKALNYPIETRTFDTMGSITVIMRKFFATEKTWRPHLYIGEKDTESCRALATLASSKNRLYISLGGNVEQFVTNKESYPTFASSGRGTHSMATVVVKLMERFHWTRVAVISALADIYTLYAHYIRHAVEAEKMVYIRYSHADSNLTQADFQLRENSVDIMLQHLRKRTNFFILLMHNKESQFILKYAAKIGLMNGENAFLVHGFVENFGIEIHDYDGFEGVLTIDRYLSIDTPEFEIFQAELRQENLNPTQTGTTASSRRARQALTPSMQMKLKYAGLMHDALMMWLDVLKNLRSKEPAADLDVIASDGQRLAALLKRVRIYGLTGLIAFTDGLRLANYTASIIEKGGHKEIFHYEADSQNYKDFKPRDLIWPGGSRIAPVERRCFEDQCYTDHVKLLLISCLGLLALIVIIAIVGFALAMLWRRLQEKQTIAKWRITWSEVQLLGDSNTTHNNSYAARGHRKSVRPSFLTQFFTPAGIYKGRLISIKKIQRPSVDIFEHSVYVELKQILYVKHDNINLFIGVCVDAPNVCIAMAYAEKGSLQGVLADPQFEIDWEFRMSLAIDIAKGMEYLHSTPVGAHGHLTSANCVIDDRWVCKITDYGLRLFRCIDKFERPLSDLLWMAPEILRKKDGDVERVYGTKPGDVYSFGIIISELLTREIPYHHGVQSVNLEELLAKVKLALEPPFRPTLPTMEDHVATEWIELAKNCWQTSPLKRPTFKTVKNTLQETNSGKFTNVLERMQIVLEESLERANVELSVEKRKTENILRNVVPKTILQAVSAGVEVEPQLIKFVTLCLCNTTGVYQATSELSADVVVNVLKSLYQKYDEIIGNYGAFEVSTWGSKDSMMLAGGLPLNATTDALAICFMALDLLGVVESFSHPYIESNVLQVKISIHTGPAYTSVMGKEIPQYCVYGETVKTTNNMHAFTKAMTVRISSATRERLPGNTRLQVKDAKEVAMKEGESLVTHLISRKSPASDPSRRKSSGRQRSSTGARRRPAAAANEAKMPTAKTDDA